MHLGDKRIRSKGPSFLLPAISWYYGSVLDTGRDCLLAKLDEMQRNCCCFLFDLFNLFNGRIIVLIVTLLPPLIHCIWEIKEWDQKEPPSFLSAISCYYAYGSVLDTGSVFSVG